MSTLLRCSPWQALLLLLPALLDFAHAAFIPFQNCLSPGILFGSPLQLQWIPLYFDARFETAYPNNLTVTLYGNVSGQQVEGIYPPPTDPSWQNPNMTLGKIVDVGSGNNYSTLFSTFQVLSYDAYNALPSEFCPHLVHGQCPLGPAFFANASNPGDLPAFRVTHDFDSAYMFSTFQSTIRVISGDASAQDLACVTANITPDLGSAIKGMLIWLPASILILKGVATLAAAIWSPWGSSDIFRWSSNYGRDEDLLRLVTPGFGDCLQYIQFAALMGSLTLQFPGFFQPALSQSAWSLLLFNQSFVSHGNGTQSLVDGIYVVDAMYGISAMRQLIGMTSSIDVWACMAVFLAIIAAIVLVLCQVGFVARWIHRVATKASEEDLRRKNLPFTLGNMVRLLFNFFILPVVALSLFQLVISSRSPASVIACAAILFAIVIIGGGWILVVIFSTKPRTILFDDMPTVLLYGPLYNTYSDIAAPFALVPVIITFMRGVAFGAVQPSGTGQIIILAICEVILIITFNGFRPFQNQTSMNAYHTFFAVVRLITVLLCIAFIPSLNISEAPKGWIGYVILLLHACVLVFGFFLNSAQTLIEVTARYFGLAGHDAQTGAARGSILSWRMLKKRQDRPAVNDRASLASNAVMLNVDEDDRRTRSMSASSQQLLNQGGTTPSQNRLSGGFDNFSAVHGRSPSAEADAAGFTYVPGPNGQGAMQGKNAETFYRPPRQRTQTLEGLVGGAKKRGVSNADLEGQAIARQGGNESPAPAFLRERTDSNTSGPHQDYTTREVDQYYRGPALAGNHPTRKLKTGPADPTSPAANAQSWFQRLMFGVQGKGKKKETGKGFEVVRRSQMPPAVQPGMQPEAADDDAVEMVETSPPMSNEPYRDSPEAQQCEFQAVAGAERSTGSPQSHRKKGSAFDFGLEGAHNQPTRAIRPESDTLGNTASTRSQLHPGMRAEQPSLQPPATRKLHSSMDVGVGYITRDSGETDRTSMYEHPSAYEAQRAAQGSRMSAEAPSLAPIQRVGEITIPSRFNSHRSGDQDDEANFQTSAAGQQWLNTVDNIDSNHGSGQTSTISQDINNPYGQRAPQPAIPVRSTRRTNSNDQTDPRFRSQSPAYDSRNVDFSDFNSGRTGAYQQYLGTSNDDDERPSSFFNTSHHRAADSITRNSFGANAALNASSAEIMGSSPPEGEAGFHEQR